jgi:ABC-type multidrug transport system ATPase subunit
MGLERYRDKPIQALSTGTRRIAEIACLVALEPTCLLLDEPSSGVAQRETEALGQLLVDLKEQLQLTLVIIEHDIPLVMGISNRIVAMADGSVLCSGTPSAVRSDPRVVDAYLGGSLAAIERSGAVRESTNGGSGGEPIQQLLRTVPGLGAARSRQLVQHFGSGQALRQSTLEELQEVAGIGPNLAQRIRDAVNGSRVTVRQDRRS